jgi:hypothetical protein
MTINRNIHRIMGMLLIADVGLLVLSGIPTFKQADDGWKWAVGAGTWLGFIGVAITLIGLSVATLVRRRCSDNRGAVLTVTTTGVDRGRRSALWGAAALIAAMVADLVETVVDPASSGETAGVFQATVQHRELMVLCGYLLLASAIFVLPGVLLLTQDIREHGRRLRRAAVVLGFMGALGHTALATAYLAWASMPGERADDPQVMAALDRIMSSAAIAPLAIGFVAFPLGIIATHGALLRARVAPQWVLAPVLTAPVAAIVSPGGNVAGTTIALVLLLFSTAVVAVRIARGSTAMSDAPGQPPLGRLLSTPAAS